jgi:hypothetical protein
MRLSVDKITKSIRKLTEINLEVCQNIELAVKELSNLKNMKVIKESCSRINKLEINLITYTIKQFLKFLKTKQMLKYY